MGGHIGATWRIRLNRPSAADMWPNVKLLWPLVYLPPNQQCQNTEGKNFFTITVSNVILQTLVFRLGLVIVHCTKSFLLLLGHITVLHTCGLLSNWPSSVVFYNSEPCKNSWNNRDSIWVEYLGGFKEPHIKWGPGLPWQGELSRERGSPLKSLRTLRGELCKNGWTDRDAVWCWTQMSSRKVGVHTGATWQILLNHPCAEAMWLVVKLLWPFVHSYWH